MAGWNWDGSYQKLIRTIYGDQRENRDYPRNYKEYSILASAAEQLINSPLSLVTSGSLTYSSGNIDNHIYRITLWEKNTIRSGSAYSVYIGTGSYYLRLTNQAKGSGQSLRSVAKCCIFVMLMLI